MPRPQPVILLPPSEGKAPGGDGPPWAVGTMADPGLDRFRRTVLREARAAGATPRRAPTRPAMARYTGVLYQELDWPSLPVVARRRGEVQVRTVSGLWGLVAPHDPIPHYKLKMSARLGELGRLSTWWRPHLSSLLADRCAGALVWDLLPIEHSAAVDWSLCTPQHRVTVRFVDSEGKVVSHWNKLLKGALVRWLLTTQPRGVHELGSLVHPLGYRYDPDATTTEGTLTSAVLRQSAAS